MMNAVSVKSNIKASALKMSVFDDAVKDWANMYPLGKSNYNKQLHSICY